MRNLHRLIRYLLLIISIFLIGLFTATSTFAKNPYLMPNNSWISISGSVESVSADAFTLNYGDGLITVEMDDGDHDADGYKLIPGDEVTVSGMIDDDLYERTTIEASSVYVEKLKTSFFASAVDEEDVFATVLSPVVASAVIVQGLVTGTGTHEFTIDTGMKTLTVETRDLLYNPLDDVGYQRIETGDLVRVTGTIDRNLFEGRELVAETVTELVD